MNGRADLRQSVPIPADTLGAEFPGGYLGGLPQAFAAAQNPLAKVGLALVPFVPVPFLGTDALFAWGRLVVYGGLAAMLWKRKPAAAYVCAGAAGVSLATSLSAPVWGK